MSPSTDHRKWSLLPTELHAAIAESYKVFNLGKLRLTCPYTRKVLRPVFLRLFEHIAVYLTPWSLLILIELARYPEIVKSVGPTTMFLVKGWASAARGWVLRGPEQIRRTGFSTRSMGRGCVASRGRGSILRVSFLTILTVSSHRVSHKCSIARLRLFASRYQLVHVCPR
jgi:hypothetical protein